MRGIFNDKQLSEGFVYFLSVDKSIIPLVDSGVDALLNCLKKSLHIHLKVDYVVLVNIFHH